MTAIQHELEWSGAIDGLARPQALIARESSRVLEPLWLYLEFVSLAPFERGEPSVIPVDPTPRLSVLVHVPLTVSIGGEIAVPSEELFESSPDGQLFDWLRLANDAARSPSDAHAIRCYFMIFEDTGGVPEELKCARHLVSHIKIDRGKTKRCVERGVGKPVHRYDPNDHDQAAFLARVRATARADVEALLIGRLPGAGGDAQA